MSIRETLFQSIATLERLTSFGPEAEKDAYVYSQASQTPSGIGGDTWEKAAGMHRVSDHDRQAGKVAIPRIAGTLHTLSNISSWAIPFVTAALAVSVVGLLAESIEWANGRKNGIVEIYLAQWNSTRQVYDDTRATMFNPPKHLDYDTTYALLVPCAICTLGGFVVGILTLVHEKSQRSINLGGKVARRSWVYPTCITLDLLMIALTSAAIIYSRELWEGERDKRYAIIPYYLDPPPGTDMGISHYQSPLRYNLLCWNCQLSKTLLYSAGGYHKIRRLCYEGIAATYLVALLLILQVGMFGCHVWTWKEQRNGKSWLRARLSNEPVGIREKSSECVGY